jgi:FMN phosphatase YigB (HAD superfamily)
MIDKTVKNIIFDLGGVLVGLDKDRCVKAFNDLGAHHISRYVEEHRSEDMFSDLEMGRIGASEFCNSVRQTTGCNADDGQICDAWNALLTGIDDKRKSALMELHRNHRLFLLSNTNIIHWNKCADDYFRYYSYGADDYFDHIFLSYEMHLVKPQRAIFAETLRQAGISAGETLFIDDSEDNCRTAQEMGIKTMHVTYMDEWIHRME